MMLVVLIGLALIHFSADRSGTPTIAVGSVAANSTVGTRIRDSVGRVGARLLGPTVRATLKESKRDLADLEPAIRRAKPHEVVRARKLAVKVVALDSAAHRSLAAGRPIRAMQQALDGKQFVKAVKMNVVEEAVFR